MPSEQSNFGFTEKLIRPKRKKDAGKEEVQAVERVKLRSGRRVKKQCPTLNVRRGTPVVTRSIHSHSGLRQFRWKVDGGSKVYFYPPVSGEEEETELQERERKGGL